MWGIIFMIRMNVKDYSLSKKVGWQEYKDKTWLLVPKLMNSAAWSFAIYVASIATFYYFHEHGL